MLLHCSSKSKVGKQHRIALYTLYIGDLSQQTLTVNMALPHVVKVLIKVSNRLLLP